MYMRREWCTDNRPTPMDEAKLNKLLKEQAKEARALLNNGK